MRKKLISPRAGVFFNSEAVVWRKQGDSTPWCLEHGPSCLCDTAGVGLVALGLLSSPSWA